MNFGEALEQCKKGARIARDGWNGKDQFVYYQKGSRVHIESVRDDQLLAWMNERGLSEVELWGHFDFKPTNNKIQCGWLATQSDMQADDWMIVRGYRGAAKAKEERSVVEVGLFLPAADIDGLLFNAQKVHAVFEQKDADGGWHSRDVLFMSARNKDNDSGMDALTQYLNLDPIRKQLSVAMGVSLSDVRVSLPMTTRETKTYNGVDCAYWIDAITRTIPSGLPYANGTFAPLYDNANSIHGVAPVARLWSPGKAS
jgi:hypothetical protein